MDVYMYEKLEKSTENYGRKMTISFITLNVLVGMYLAVSFFFLINQEFLFDLKEVFSSFIKIFSGILIAGLGANALEKTKYSDTELNREKAFVRRKMSDSKLISIFGRKLSITFISLFTGIVVLILVILVYIIKPENYKYYIDFSLEFLTALGVIASAGLGANAVGKRF